MPVDKTGEQRGVVRLVQQVAANNQVELPQGRVAVCPTAAEKRDYPAVVEPGIVLQQRIGRGVVVAGGNIRQPLVQQQAGQAQAAAHFQDTQAADIVVLHHAGEQLARRPQHPEHGPGGGTDTQRLGQALGIVKLLPVAQAAQVDVLVANLQGAKSVAELCHAGSGTRQRMMNGRSGDHLTPCRPLLLSNISTVFPGRETLYNARSSKRRDHLGSTA